LYVSVFYTYAGARAGVLQKYIHMNRY